MKTEESVSNAAGTEMLSEKVQSLVNNVDNVLVGQSHSIRLATIALLAGGHAIVEDVPGVGKTLLAKSLASSIQGSFKRVQCTPDLMPSDISGISIFDQKESVFKFAPGPIFTNILLTDEINRATPRTQSALLEAMEEHQVTTDGVTRRLPNLFFVMATQNPIEQHGTFPLPEAQLDRFMICLSMGYPKPKEEGEILKKTLQDGAFSVEPVLTTDDVLAARMMVRQVFLHDLLVDYIIEIVNATRRHPSIVLGVSPRGSQLLMKASQAAAFLAGRKFVKPEDIKELAPSVFGHRIIPKVRSNRVSHAEIIEKVLDTVPVPD